jgi:hypothetical protein
MQITYLLYMGIIGNFHSMVEAFLDVFSSRESVFIDPKLNDYYVDDEYLLNVQLRHSTSKVKFYYYGLYVFVYVVLY